MSEPRKRKQRDGGEVERKGRRGWGKALRVPPPDSAIWPEQYRGANWKSIYAILFAGRCQLCAYSSPLPRWRQLRDKFHGETRLLLCTNHLDSPGELDEVLPIETCRNFQAKHWRRPCPKPAKARAPVTMDEDDRQVRRIPLGNGLFATVDTADYEEIHKYRWRAIRNGREN